MYNAAIAGSNGIYLRSSNQPTAGVSVEHPAQATIFAKQGKINVLIPFELTIIPLAPNSIEPEIPSRSNVPISGSIPSQNANYYHRSNQNVYRPIYPMPAYPPNNQGFYVPAAVNSYQPFIPNQQSNGYRPTIYQPAQNLNRNQYYSPNAMYAPLYQQPLRKIDMRPWPQYNRPVGK